MDLERRDKDDEQQQAFLPRSREDIEDVGSAKVWNKKTSLSIRLILEVLAALIIAILLFRIVVDWKSENKASPVPNFPRRTYTFLEDTKYLNEDMFASKEDTLHTLHNWIPLSSDGRGYVQIEDPGSFGLGEPYTTQNLHTSKMEPVYMMAIFHQLHCLSYLVTHFQAGFNGTELTKEVAHHSAHCFDYLRQGIMCNADTTLEGKTDVGPGWGHEHECKDYEALLKWANEKTVVKWKTNMPNEATL